MIGDQRSNLGFLAIDVEEAYAGNVTQGERLYRICQAVQAAYNAGVRAILYTKNTGLTKGVWTERTGNATDFSYLDLWVTRYDITNTSHTTITDPISLVLDVLSSNTTLYNRSGITQYAVEPADGNNVPKYPAGSSYLNLPINGLRVGASVIIKLEFSDTGGEPISYQTHVVAGTGSR